MPKAASPEQKTLYNLYAMFGVSLVLCVIPYVSAAVLFLLVFTALLIACYALRKKSIADSLIDNHTTYIISTLWISAIIPLFTMAIATIYLVTSIDHDPFKPCTDTILSIGLEKVQSMPTKEIYKFFEPCMKDFMSYNSSALFIAIAIGPVPPFIYLIYRFFKGLNFALKGRSILNPKNWL